MYNRIVLVGRLTRDPELRHTSTGKAVAGFRLAVDRGTTNAQGERQTDFIDVVVWERQAELVSQYLSKGRLVLVEGRLEMRQFETQDGQRRTVYEVRANTVRFLPDGRRDQSGGGGGFGGGGSGYGDRFGGGGSGYGDRPSGGAGGSEPDAPFGSDFTPDDDDVPF